MDNIYLNYNNWIDIDLPSPTFYQNWFCPMCDDVHDCRSLKSSMVTSVSRSYIAVITTCFSAVLANLFFAVELF